MGGEGETVGLVVVSDDYKERKVRMLGHSVKKG